MEEHKGNTKETVAERKRDGWVKAKGNAEGNATSVGCGVSYFRVVFSTFLTVFENVMKCVSFLIYQIKTGIVHTEMSSKGEFNF